MKKLIFCLFGFIVLINFPLQAMEIDMSMLNDMSKNISKEIHLHTIVGFDDREEITGKATGPEKAVIVIDIVSNDGHSYICSGSIIGYKTVLTAAHCLIDDRGKYAKEIKVYATGMPAKEEKPKGLTPASNDNEEPNNYKEELVKKVRKGWEGAFPDGSKFPNAKAKSLWVPDKYKKGIHNNDETEKQDNDYGIIFLDSELGKDIGQVLGLKVLSEVQFFNIDIVVIGRGYDKSNYSLWKSPGHIKKDDVLFFMNMVFFDADVMEGNSGGPIFKKNDPKNIIALATGELPANCYDCSPNVGLPIRQEIVNNVNRAKKGELKTYNLLDTD